MWSLYFADRIKWYFNRYCVACIFGKLGWIEQACVQTMLEDSCSKGCSHGACFNHVSCILQWDLACPACMELAVVLAQCLVSPDNTISIGKHANHHSAAVQRVQHSEHVFNEAAQPPALFAHILQHGALLFADSLSTTIWCSWSPTGMWRAT